jgi:uncharacterized membrane protein
MDHHRTLTLAIAGLACLGTAQAPPFRLQVVPIWMGPNHTGAIGAGINDSRTAAAERFGGFLYFSQATGSLFVTPGGTDHYLYKVTDNGEVVGTAAWSSWRGFTWHPVHGLRLLPYPLGGTVTWAKGASDSGLVVGFYYLNAVETPCYWPPGGGVVSLGLPNSPYGAIAEDANDAGEILVGTGNAQGRYVTYLWRPVTGWQPTGMPPGGRDLFAADLNDAGQALFYGYDESFNIHGWRQEANGAWTEMLRPIPVSGSRPVDLNDKGEAAGWAYVSGNQTRAAYWDAQGNGHMVKDLLDATGAGWDLRTARAINNRGDMLASGWHQGVFRTCLLVRVPRAVVRPPDVPAGG